jgi:protein-disulfide isomerase
VTRVLRPRSLLVLLLAAAPALARAQGQDDLQSERTKGSAAAPVTMYEISDFECPYCAEFWRETLPSIERDYVATGKVRIIFVNMPLPMHPNAGPAAELAMCAARQHKFWQVHDLLFRHQDRWADLKEPGVFFLSLADSAGADRSQIQECLRSAATRPVVAADFEGARRSGAHSTPTFYIEGGLVEGAQPFSLFKTVLDSIWAAKTRPGAARAPDRTRRGSRR